MINFFRKIRKDLLSGGNTSKYLKYAIGEILLVVIGILIALQVNNWNVQRINNNLEAEYLSQLIDGLNADISFFTDLQSAFSQKKEKTERLLGIWKSHDFFIPDSIQYINDFISAGDMYPWYNEPVTWTQLVQSGDLKILKDQDVVDGLFSYYSRMKKAAVNYDAYTNHLVNEARQNWVIPFTVKSYEKAVPPFTTAQVPSREVYVSIQGNISLYLPLYSAIAIACNVHAMECSGFIKDATDLAEQLKSTLQSKSSG